MRDNVFAPSFGNRPSQLVGRDKAVSDLADGLDAKPGNRKRAILLLGQRGTGKTVLLWEFADRAKKHGFVVASPTTTGANLLQRIIEKLQDSGEELLSSNKAKLEGGSVQAFGFSVGLQFSREEQPRSFHYKLSKICQKLNEKGKGVLILVDEVRANDPEVRELVTAYQELVGNGADIALVLAGLPAAISETLNDSVLTFLNRAHKIELGPLNTNEVFYYYRKVFDELEISLTEAQCHAAAQATQGSPYMLQLLGHNLVRAADNGAISPASFERAEALAREDFITDICKTSLQPLSDKDISFLKAMSGDCPSSKISDVAARMGVTPDYAQKYRKRLIDAGIISVPRRAYVEFAIPFLNDYLQKQTQLLN